VELANDSGPVWLALDAALHTQLSTHGLILSPPPASIVIGPEGIQFHQLSWILLQPGRRCHDGTSKFQQHPTMTGILFTVRELMKVRKTPNPLSHYPCQQVLVLGQLHICLVRFFSSKTLSVDVSTTLQGHYRQPSWVQYPTVFHA
jgi:hypothetical protein